MSSRLDLSSIEFLIACLGLKSEEIEIKVLVVKARGILKLTCLIIMNYEVY